MHLFKLSPAQIGVLLPFLLSFPINAATYELDTRGNSLCCIGMCDDDENGNQAPTLDGPTSDKSAGIGVEFESGAVLFQSKGTCAKPDIDKSKGAQVNARKGTNWALTADTTASDAGFLTAEYILNGKTIKIGSGDAAKAASAVAGDIVSFLQTIQNSCL